MINIQDLWSKRFAQHSNETRRYLRYMLNDHLLFVLLFALGGAAYYYKGWVASLPNDFPYLFVLSIVLSFVLTNSPIRTFLKEADIAFLLQIELKLAGYFKRSMMYSLMMQSWWIIIAFIVLLPIYSKFIGNSFQMILLSLILFVLIKFWNIKLKWTVQYYSETKVHHIDTVIRFLLNFTFLYFLFAKAHIIFLICIGIIMLLLYGYFHKSVQNKTLKWDFLIDQEAKRMMLFYRVANLFTDVPKLKDRVKRRKWLDWALKSIHYSKQNTYKYLYLRTFIRTSDYFGLFIRLTIIGGLALYFAPFYYGKLIVTVLFIYLTGFQLTTLWKHHDMKMWINLYPITVASRLQSFIKLLSTILMIQTILLSFFVFVNGQLILATLSLIIGILFSLLFVHFYIQNKIRKLT